VDLLETDLARIWRLDYEQDGHPTHLVGLFNWSGSEVWPVRRPLDRTDLDGDTTYVGFDYWADRFVPPFKGRLVGDLPPGSCRVLALREVRDRPQVVSTSRHVTQGLVDLDEVSWDANKGVLSGVSRVVKGDRYELRVVVPTGPSSWIGRDGEVTLDGHTLPLELLGEGPTLRVAFVPPSSGRATWVIRFRGGTVKAPPPAAPIDLAAEAGYRRVSLHWQAEGALGFRVERDDGTTWRTTASSLIDRTVPPGAAVTYRVRARGWTPVWSEAAAVRVKTPAELKAPPNPPAPDIHLDSLKSLSARQGWGSLRVNRSVENKPLTLGGEVFERGLGTHAPSTLVFALPKNAARFVARVGLDDEKKDDPRSSVVFKVFGDVKEMGEPPELLGESPVLSSKTLRAWSFDLPLSDRFREIRLVVEDAGDGKAGDHADWVNAGFITRGLIDVTSED
jgi:hypothetical protein